MLVVEDNAELRHVLKEALALEGWDVLAARDEADALEVLQQNRVDLLISDLPASDGDGLERVRRDFPTLAVVAFAGAGDALSFSPWRSDGRFRTLPKPFRLREVLAVTRELLGSAT